MSKLRTDLAVDDPVTLTADYKLGASDRRKIDDQIIDLQQAVVDGILSGGVCSQYTLSGASAPLAAGMVFCTGSDGLMKKATAAALAIAGCSAGVAVTAVPPGARFRGLIAGVIPPEISGLGPGSASNVRINTTTAVLERVDVPGSGDFLVGFADSLGRVTVRGAPGAPGVDGGRPIQITTVIDKDVASLSAAPTAWNGYTFQNGDLVALANQSNTAHNTLYTWGTGGVLTLFLPQPNDGVQLITTVGSRPFAPYIYRTGSVSMLNASTGTYVGPNGTVGNTAPDAVGLAFVLNDPIPRQTIPHDGAWHTVWQFNFSGSGFVLGRLDVNAKFTFSNGPKGCSVLCSAIVDCATATISGSKIADVTDDSGGSGGYIDGQFVTVGGAVAFQVKNLQGSDVNGGGLASGYIETP